MLGMEPNRGMRSLDSDTGRFTRQFFDIEFRYRSVRFSQVSFRPSHCVFKGFRILTTREALRMVPAPFPILRRDLEMPKPTKAELAKYKQVLVQQLAVLRGDVGSMKDEA